jgi:LuxR family transcriptional regulator, maltose regulon positive regulatory protein
MSLAKPSSRERQSNNRASKGGDAPFRPAFPVIESKVTAPPLRAGMVRRERLLRQLLDGGPSVVSLVAPPGYGKTTLLSQWASACPGPVVWLTIDAIDNDPSVLMSYLGAALDRIVPISRDTAKALSGDTRRVLTSAVPRLVSELHAWRKPGLIIFDDAHLLTNRLALDAVSMLIDHLPAGFRMAVAGRHEPSLPFARLAAHRELVKLGREELALDASETSELAAAAGQVLSADEISALSAKTEGWAVGVYLATVALGRGRPDFGPPSSFTGADPHIAAYLRSEFEDDLDSDDMTFLTRSVVLERISVPAADAVTELPDSGQRLRRLALRSQLIHELPGPESTYRYHNLLRDFLALELEAREPGATRRLHRRAAAWYQGAQEIDLAIEHALAAEDYDTAARFVTAAAYPAHQRGRTATLERWLAAFSDAAFARHPSLAVSAAWVMLFTGRGDDADAMADIAERATYHGSPGDGSASFASQRAMLRAALARSGPRDALASAKIAVALERPGSTWRATALMLAGSAYEMLDDVDAAELAYIESIGAGAASSWATVMTSCAKRAQLCMNAGDWSGAEELIERAEELRELWRFDGLVSVLFVHAINARICIQSGDFDRGREALVRAQLLRPLANHAAPWLSVDALLNLSRAYLAISDPAGAQLALREAENIVRRRPSLGTLTKQLVEVRARLADATSTLIGSSALTAAELRVLPFLPTYLSFQEIAERLMISRNTVKTHAMSIYGKLWASSRGEAVERAVEMGLLEPYPALARTVANVPGNGVPHLRLLSRNETEDEAQEEAEDGH